MSKLHLEWYSAIDLLIDQVFDDELTLNVLVDLFKREDVRAMILWCVEHIEAVFAQLRDFIDVRLTLSHCLVHLIHLLKDSGCAPHGSVPEEIANRG